MHALTSAGKSKPFESIDFRRYISQVSTFEVMCRPGMMDNSPGSLRIWNMIEDGLIIVCLFMM